MLLRREKQLLSNLVKNMIKLNVSSPNGEIVSAESDFIVARTDTGEMGFLENHAPIIARISDGFIRYNNKYIAIHGGIMDVNNNVITVVCQYAMQANDLETAKKMIEDYLEKQLKESKRKMVDFAQAEKELIKSIKKAGASKL